MVSEIIAESVSAAAPLSDLVVGDANLFAQNMDDAASLDPDDEDTGFDDTAVDYALDTTFIASLSGILASQQILNSGSLAVTIRREGLECRHMTPNIDFAHSWSKSLASCTKRNSWARVHRFSAFLQKI